MEESLGGILRPAQERYLAQLLPPRDPLLAEMEEAARRDGIPISNPHLGRLLEILARATDARRILEIGTAIGYGTLYLARGAPEARVITIDPDPLRLATARTYLSRGRVLERVELLEGRALDLLPNLQGPFDLAYLDALKTEYRHYLDLVLPRLAVGGVVVVDNLLWHGRVAEPPDEEAVDAETEAIRAFNPYFLSHPQLRAVILPLGDGVGLAIKTQPLISELGGPYG